MFINSEIKTISERLPNDSPVIDKLFDTIEKKDLKIEELLKENTRLEERLRLLEPDKSDFIKIAEDGFYWKQFITLTATVRPLPVPL